MSKQPFLPLFFGDFLASTAEWTGEEASLYLTLLGHQWTLGTLPADPAKLSRLVRWERKGFDRCWPQVSAKFVEVDGRLVNDRLEQHRAKADEVAQKNRQAGRKGAESRWRKDGERHGEASSDAMASAKDAPWHPSQSIPSQPEVLPPSSPAPDLSASTARTRTLPPDVPRGVMAQIRNRYPPGTYRDADWLLAERAVRKLLGDGVLEESLLAAAEAYGQQQAALEKAGTQYVLKPSSFFANDEWRGPFQLPAKQETALERITRLNTPTTRVIEHEPDDDASRRIVG